MLRVIEIENSNTFQEQQYEFTRSLNIDSLSGKYTGYHKRFIAEGLGVLISTENNLTYMGEFKDNKFDGIGKMSNAKSKQVYIGGFKEGFSHGRGIEIHSDGTRYEGVFEKGQKSGVFKVIKPSGKVEE